MKIGKHGVREHVRLLLPSFALVLGVWLLRLILAAAASHPAIIRVVSVTVATAAAILLAVLALHFRQFGGYASVVVASLLLNAWAQVLVIAAIVVAGAAGTENIYTAPEFSMPGDDPMHVRHIYGHLTFGIGGGTLIGAAGGCLLLALLRRLVPVREGKPRETEAGEP